MKTHDTDTPDYQKLLDDDGVTVCLCYRFETVVSRKSISSRRIIYVLATIFALLEAALIFLAVAGVKSLCLSHCTATRLNVNEYPMGYWSLEHQNITATSFRIHNAADMTPEAEEFWRELLKDVGIVTIHEQWVADNDLPPSLQHPEDDSHYVYQVGAYHNFYHLLSEIRGNDGVLAAHRLINPYQEHVREVLTSSDPEHSRTDRHTLHCIDRIRERLMCHPDASFNGTIDYVQWDVHPEGHPCRDLDALQSWTHDHLKANHSAFYAARGFSEMNENFGRQMRADEEAHPDVTWDHVETITHDSAGAADEDIYHFVHHHERVLSLGEKFQKL